MIAVELLSNKLQELFGGGYYIMPNHIMNTEYTTAIEVNEYGNRGYRIDYNDKYSILRKSKVIGVVNLQNPERANSQSYYLTSGFTVDFSVPLNVNKSCETQINAYFEYDKTKLVKHWKIYLDKRTCENLDIECILLDKLDGQIIFVKHKFTIPSGLKEYNLDYVQSTNLDDADLIAYKNRVKITKSTPEKYKCVNFDFFADYEDVAKAIINKEIYFNDSLKGRITFNEPTFTGIETDGEIKYGLYKISGACAISDSNSTFGSDYRVFIEKEIFGEKQWLEVEGINSYCEILNNGANAIVEQNTTKTKQNLSQSGWVCSFSVDDIYTSPDKANRIFANIIHNNLEIINGKAISESEKRKLKVKIAHGEDVRVFFAIVNITFKTTRNGVGTYEISLTDDNKGG